MSGAVEEAGFQLPLPSGIDFSTYVLAFGDICTKSMPSSHTQVTQDTPWFLHKSLESCQDVFMKKLLPPHSLWIGVALQVHCHPEHDGCTVAACSLAM